MANVERRCCICQHLGTTCERALAPDPSLVRVTWNSNGTQSLARDPIEDCTRRQRALYQAEKMLYKI